MVLRGRGRRNEGDAEISKVAPVGGRRCEWEQGDIRGQGGVKPKSEGKKLWAVRRKR